MDPRADRSAILIPPILDRVISSEYSHLVVVGAPALKSEYGLDSGFQIGLDLILDTLDRTAFHE